LEKSFLNTKLFFQINFNNIFFSKILKQMPKVLKMPNLIVSNEYIENFKKADNTFKYQIVFDPRARKQVPLNPYDENISSDDFPYAGV